MGCRRYWLSSSPKSQRKKRTDIKLCKTFCFTPLYLVGTQNILEKGHKIRLDPQWEMTHCGPTKVGSLLLPVLLAHEAGLLRQGGRDTYRPSCHSVWDGRAEPSSLKAVRKPWSPRQIYYHHVMALNSVMPVFLYQEHLP